jgi:hypothetical protein
LNGHQDPKNGEFKAHRRELSLRGRALIDLLQATLGRGSSIRLKAKGRSMSPFIQDGDILRLSPADSNSLSVGDVVAFRFSESDRIAIHRVTGKIDGHYLIRGDYCSEPDGLIPGIDILGQVSMVERCGKEISFGLGPERHIIAFLSGRDLLCPILSVVDALRRRSSRILGAIYPVKPRRLQGVAT